MSFLRHQPGTVKHVLSAGFPLGIVQEPSWKCLERLGLFHTLCVGGRQLPGFSVPGHIARVSLPLRGPAVLREVLRELLHPRVRYSSFSFNCI